MEGWGITTTNTNKAVFEEVALTGENAPVLACRADLMKVRFRACSNA